MKCIRIQSLLSQYLEGELRPFQVELVSQHVTECDNCARELAGLRRAVGALARSRFTERPLPDLADLHRRIAAHEVRKLSPRWRWGFAVAPAASLVLVMLWFVISSTRGPQPPSNVAHAPGTRTTASIPYGPLLPSILPPGPAAVELPAATPSISERIPDATPYPVRVSRIRPEPAVDIRIWDETPVKPPVREAHYKVSLGSPEGTVSMSSRAHHLATGEPAKIYINYEGPAPTVGGAGSEVTHENGTTL